jgi:hypothetical protein
MGKLGFVGRWEGDELRVGLCAGRVLESFLEGDSRGG